MLFLKSLTRLSFIYLLILPAFIIGSCKAKVRKVKSPDHYHFSKYQEFKLDIKIREISGLTWDTKNDVYVAINDEFGKLYLLTEDAKDIIPEPYIFGGRGDYEDVAVIGGVPYILRSDGQITQLLKDTSGIGYTVKSEKINLPGTNDFETLYYDADRKALIMLCKSCEMDDKNTVSAFAYYPDSIGFVVKPVFTINAAEVIRLSKRKTTKLQPSAAAIHPITHKLYILSSASSQLVIADVNGKVDSVYELAKKLFPQPEGIAFRKDGTMLISNEGMSNKAVILQFAFDSASRSSTESTTAYNFSKPDEKMELGDHLHEISGMTWIPGKNHILAENDEKGQIFTLDFAGKKDELGKVKFGGKGDYEDIVYTADAIYMLIATGGIVRVDTKDSAMTTTEFLLPGEKNEFEALYLDKEKKSLIMLCKECDHEKDEIRAAYRFDLATNSFDPDVLFTIDIKEIQNILSDDKAEFKPSAAGVNPIDHKLYIVASVGKLLVVADKNTGKVEKVFKLDPEMYNQPEGMTFAPNGDLYISNEGGDGTATILKFLYRR